MTQPGVNSLEDRKHEVEYLKQTIENFERLSDIMKKVEQEVLTNSRYCDVLLWSRVNAL